jgi:transcriptional regulator with XRE-family HTH domain
MARLRRAKGWNQRELAERAGSKSTQISKFERGRYQPRLETLTKLAEAFESTTDFLLTGRHPEETRDTRLRARLPLLEGLPQELRDVFLEFLDALLNANETIGRARKRKGKD